MHPFDIFFIFFTIEDWNWSFLKTVEKGNFGRFFHFESKLWKKYGRYPKTDAYFCWPYCCEYSVKISGQYDENCERSRILSEWKPGFQKNAMTWSVETTVFRLYKPRYLRKNITITTKMIVFTSWIRCTWYLRFEYKTSRVMGKNRILEYGRHFEKCHLKHRKIDFWVFLAF